MPLQLPNLDSRTYDDLVAEAKQRIPRYLPQWTDLNDSDPGITLVQLFAWMTEATLYELNRTPDALRLKLLQLLGFETEQAQAASTQLTFTMTAGTNWTIVPKGTRVAASGATMSDGTPVIFESDRAVVAIGAPLIAVASMVNGIVNRFFDAKQPAMPEFVPVPPVIVPADSAALYLGFDATQLLPNVEIDLTFFLSDAPGDMPAWQCTFGRSPTPPAQWVWEHFDPSLGSWRPLKLLSDETAALYRTGHVIYSYPTTPLPSSVLLGINAYWVRARIDRANYDDAPVIVAVTTNTAPATQALTQTNEVVGASDGTPSQTFTLSHAPVLPNTLELQVDEGTGGATTWKRVDDFFGSGTDAKVYTLDSATGSIAFGDGEFGSIPLANPANANNIYALVYRYGGGKVGNVAANNVTDLQSYVAFVDSVTNPAAAFGGVDEESQQATTLRAAHAIKSTNRAVTAEDFEALALIAPGTQISRSHALPLYHPDYPGIDVPGCVTVIVVPDIDDRTRAPEPSKTTLQLICAWLDEHRLITTELHVIGPTYRKLAVSFTAICSNDSDLASVAQTIDAALHGLYDPVRSENAEDQGLLGEDEPGVSDYGWAWGAPVYPAVAFGAAMNVTGIVRVTDFAMMLDGVPIDTLGEADIGPTELIWLPPDGVSISPQYAGTA